jgi:hypothetical protein
MDYKKTEAWSKLLSKLSQYSIMTPISVDVKELDNYVISVPGDKKTSIDVPFLGVCSVVDVSFAVSGS